MISQKVLLWSLSLVSRAVNCTWWNGEKNIHGQLLWISPGQMGTTKKLEKVTGIPLPRFEPGTDQLQVRSVDAEATCKVIIWLILSPFINSGDWLMLKMFNLGLFRRISETLTWKLSSGWFSSDMREFVRDSGAHWRASLRVKPSPPEKWGSTCLLTQLMWWMKGRFWRRFRH